MRAQTGVLAGQADDGPCWAAFDAAARHVQPRVAHSRLSARLAPFQSRAEAEAALIAHGAAVVEGER